MARVNVVIPTRNRPKRTETAVRSALSQTFADLEVIVVDDGSTDDTPDTVAGIADSRLTLVRLEKKLGAPIARNLAIARARGEFIAFLDSDDAWFPEKIAEQVGAMDAAGNEVCMVHTRREPEPAYAAGLTPPSGDVRDAILERNFVAFSTALVRRRALLALRMEDGTGPFDPGLPSCQDWDLWIRLSRKGEFLFLDKPLAGVAPSPDSISSDAKASVAGLRIMAARHADAAGRLPRAMRAARHLNLARNFWWKRAIPDALSHALRALAVSPGAACSRFLSPAGRAAAKPKSAPPEPPVVVQLIEHLRIGGAERVVAGLCNSLDTARYRPAVCLYRDTGPLYETLAPQVSRTFLRKNILADLSGVPIPAWAATALESPAFILRLARLLRKQQASIVHCHLFSAGLWGRLAAPAAGLLGARARVVFTEHSAYAGNSPAKRAVLNRLLLPLADRVTAVSKEVAASTAREFGLSPESVAVVENGVQASRIPPPPPPLSEDLDRDPAPRIISIARLAPEKRLDLMLDTAAALMAERPLTVWIVGDGPERSALEARAGELGVAERVRFLGERTDATDLLPYADALLNTSEREGLPISILEAMAAKVPVAAPAVGGIPGVVRNGTTGLLFPKGDRKAAIRAVRTLLDDPALAARLADAAHELVLEHYSLRENARKWMELYDAVLGVAPHVPQQEENNAD